MRLNSVMPPQTAACVCRWPPAHIQQLLVVPTAVTELGGGHRNARQLGEAGVAFDVIRAERLFDEVRVVLLEAAQVLPGLHSVDPAIVAVEHQLDIIADGLPRGLHTLLHHRARGARFSFLQR